MGVVKKEGGDLTIPSPPLSGTTINALRFGSTYRWEMRAYAVGKQYQAEQSQKAKGKRARKIFFFYCSVRSSRPSYVGRVSVVCGVSF